MSAPKRRFAERLFRWSLALLPRWFRERVGADMARTFAARLAAAKSDQEVCRAILSDVASVLFAALRLHCAWALRRPYALAAGPSQRSANKGRLLMNPQEVKQALRSLLGRPAFALAAVTTLSLGIGATTAIYSMVDAVLLAPLPYGDPDELVTVRSVPPNRVERAVAISAGDEWRRSARSLRAHSLYRQVTRIVSSGGEPEEIRVVAGEYNLFDVLRVKPEAGRGFTAENQPNGGRPDVIVLGWKVWQRRFGGDPALIGRSIILQEKPYEVVGVMPRAFEFPVGADVAAWVPLVYDDTDRELRDVPMLEAIARLAPGVTLAGAQAELGAILGRIAREARGPYGTSADPGDSGEGWSAAVRSARTVMLGSDAALLMMLAAVGLLLFIACANVANLFLVRASERRNELLVRSALGAGRARVVVPLVLEVLIVTAASAAIGLLLARWAAVGLIALDPGGLPRWQAISVNARAWLVATSAALIAALTCGVAPALAATRIRAADVVRADARSTDSGRRLRVRDGIVGFQIALVFVLLVGAGLLLRSFDRVRSVDTGVAVERLLTARVILPPERYGFADDSRIDFYNNLLAQLRTTPGVLSAGAISVAPMNPFGTELNGLLTSPVTGEKLDGTRLRFATPGALATLGIPIRGRDFEPGDRSGRPRVTILNEEAARRMFPGRDAVGQSFKVGLKNEYEVIGVVPNIRYGGPEAAITPEYYAPQAQFRFTPGMVLVIRTLAEPAAFARALVATVRAIDPGLPVANVMTMEESLNRVLARRRFDLVMLMAIAGAALTLALVGVFGVMAHAVDQRRRELAIRTALGAAPHRLFGIVMRRTLVVTSVALVVGGSTAVAFARSLRHLLFGISALDPLTFTVAGCLLAATGILAAVLPALRAARVAPADVLRA